MPDLALVETLEKRLVNAWPSLETLALDGWLLRFARGYSKRANAASPMTPNAALDAEAIHYAAQLYRAQKIRPVFRVTPLAAPDADNALSDAGFELFDESMCLAAPLALGRGRADRRVSIGPRASPRWVEAAAASYGGDKADHSALAEIVARIRPTAAFATLVEDGVDIAWGLAVAERGYVGLFDIVVAPQARARGLGRAIVTTLMGWGHGEGAHSAYLQVRVTNEPAIALYRSLGFSEAYRYTHRVEVS
jgi:ribosomal protein S18 acetylase RimI-like enzyme